MENFAKEQKLKNKLTLKVNLKSLASEALFIRKEERKLISGKSAGWIYSSLHIHRTDHLRDHTRHTLLAYCYVKGTPYSAVESNPREKPSLKKILDKLKRHRISEHKNLSVEEWLNG